MKIALFGANSLEGREILNVMELHSFPKDDIVALDRREFAGKEISYGEDEIIKIKAQNDFNPKDVFAAVLILPENEAKKKALELSEKGIFVVDTSKAFALSPDVPLVVNGVNDDSLIKYSKKKIISMPSPSGFMLASVLKPLKDIFGLERASAVIMLSTAALGKEAMDELFNQTKGVYMNESIKEHQAVFPKQIAFNVLPFVTDIDKYGFLSEEKCTLSELEKVMGGQVNVNVNIVTIPTFFGSCAYINVQTKKEINVAEAVSAFEETENITVFNSNTEEGYATPVEMAGEDAIFLSRFKKDLSVKNGLNIFASMETTRAGMAVNTVKIVETLVDKFYDV